MLWLIKKSYIADMPIVFMGTHLLSRQDFWVKIGIRINSYPLQKSEWLLYQSLLEGRKPLIQMK